MEKIRNHYILVDKIYSELIEKINTIEKYYSIIISYVHIEYYNFPIVLLSLDMLS